MKTVKTVSASIPSDLLDKLDKCAEEMHISRSSLLTVLIVQYFENDKEGLHNALFRRQQGR